MDVGYWALDLKLSKNKLENCAQTSEKTTMKGWSESEWQGAIIE